MQNKLIFFSLTNMGFPNGGEGGGPPLGKNSHIFPFFWGGASLSLLFLTKDYSLSVKMKIHKFISF